MYACIIVILISVFMFLLFLTGLILVLLQLNTMINIEFIKLHTGGAHETQILYPICPFLVRNASK